MGFEKMRYSMTACLFLCCCLLSGCNHSFSPLAGGGRSDEMYNEREYVVSNYFYCPAFDEGRWGIVFLEIADITDQEIKAFPFKHTMTITSGREQQSVEIDVAGKNITCPFERKFVNVYFNDESGVYCLARFEMNDPKIDCLFYTNENRAEMIDFWHQLIEEKGNYPEIFVAPKYPAIR